jgi:hypothetical protein
MLLRTNDPDVALRGLTEFLKEKKQEQSKMQSTDQGKHEVK